MAFRASVRPSAEFRNNAEANHLGLAGTPASAGRKLLDLHRPQDPDTGRPDGIALRRAASVGTGGSDLGCGIGFHGDLVLGQHRIALRPAEAGAAA